MFAGLDVKDLIELKLDLHYAEQKAERAFTTLISHQHREKNLRNYTADQMIEGRKELELAEFALRTAAQKIIPILEALVEEGVLKP